MSLVEIKEIPNGKEKYRLNIYSCDKCGMFFNDSEPHTEKSNNTHYCFECSFILNFISEKDYLEHSGIFIANAHAVVRFGEVIIFIGKKAPWERTAKDIRSSKEYSDWRKQVFERDKYTCQHCFEKGGQLNAHHIKEFAKYEKLRFRVDNGLTLCVECHKKVHKKR